MIIKEFYKKMYHGSCNSEDWSKDCCKISFTGINYILNYNKIEKKSRYFNISVFYFCFHFYKYKNCIYCAYRFIPKYLCYSIWTLFPLERHITWSVQQIFNILLLYSYTTSLWCLLCCTVFQKKHLHPVGDEETDRSRERDWAAESRRDVDKHDDADLHILGSCHGDSTASLVWLLFVIFVWESVPVCVCAVTLLS